uniref:beta-ketoacyl synthase N-terminal-like domain-containing protein n=1 Tax=Steroidobacter gossypii TaxID=2805490 RepID=UPI0022AA3901|nr:beta-ketoacyl synthase N-terminal-like domain-containing protein [Steroidobacter gossypii]
MRTGGTDLAIAGGVNLSIHPGKYSMLSAGQFISSAGHCQSFGEGGDGYIPGEGVGAVILKRLSDAERDGDAIYAIIRGSALNHGGKTNGYTVPNPQAQAAVIGQALRDAGISARQVSYIEAHGTGTKLGDPIEIAALSKAFQQYTGDTQFCLLGSAKSNIGHCESAAGIAGLTKVVLQLRHRQIVPSLHSQRLNPNIDFERSPFIVNQQLRDWEAPVVDGKPVARIAGLSSFGAGGANAHLLVEEYTAPLKHESVQESAPCVVLLSARTLTQLQQKSRDLKAFIDNDPNIDLLSLAYTTQIGREAMDERVGILVSSREQLLERLALFAASASEDDGALADDMFYAQIKRHRDAMALFSADEDLQASVDGWFRAGKWSRLVDVWTKGLEIDWRRLYASSVPRRLHLPTYPFARERYWREDADERTDAIVVPLSGHSLLQQNISKPGQQRYRSLLGVDGQRYRGIELFGNPILSRGVLIEAARAALEDALPSFERSSALELHDVRLASPVETLEHVPVEISVLLPGQGRRPAPEDVAFEITSQSAEPVVLCQGLARECADEPAHVLDVASLLRRASPMLGDKNAVASACQSLGLEIAPLYQAVTSVHQATDGLLLTFESSDASRAAFADFVVQPAVLDGALIAAQWLRRPVGDGLYLPASIATLRCNVASQQPQYAWIQLSNAQPRNDAFSVDVTICDADGNVCASFGQLTLVAAKLQPAAEIDAPIAEPSEPTIHTPDRAFAALDKPTAIDLTTPEEIDALAVSSTLHKPALALAARADARDLDEGVSIVLDERGAGIFTLRLQRNEGRFDERLIGELEQALKRARDLPTIKALVIESDDQRLPSADQDVLASEAARALWHTLASFPYPTVAVLSKAASGAGFWIACVCDFVVAVDDQSYGLETADGWSLTQAWQRDWLDARFGEPFAALLAMNTSNLLGRELRDAGWGARVVAQAQVDGVVQELCQGLGEKTQSALRLLKQHMAMEFEARVAELSSAESSRAISAPRESVLQATSAPSCVESVRSDNNQVHLRLRSRNGTGTAAALLELRVALEACSGASAVLLSSELNEFLPEDAARHSQTLQQLVFAVLQLNAPIIAVLDRNATNAGFLLALACDAAVYSEGGRYGGLALRDHRDHLALLDEVTRQRLGVWASVWTLTGMMSGACELRQRLPMLEVCSADAVMDKAQQLADTLSAVSRDLFRRKTALVARIRQREQPYVEQATADALPTQEMRLALTSSVVRASVDADGVVLVHLEDRDAKNMFSDALIAGLQEVFEHVRQSLSYKAVVLVGYDTYFASGGTRDGLKAIHAGKVRFTDLDVFQLAMRCPLPVVAAMQGHGIGAGWTLGLFADCMVFSEESRYVSPYMNFGFTPGAGATGVLPLKLGLDLARDSLFTGREMLGSEIQQRNPLLTVVPRAQVLSDAMAIARSLSRHDRNDLLAWKAASTAHRLAAWEALFAREVAMHEATLVGQTDTLARIEQRFSPSASAPAKAEVSLSSASSQRVDVLPTIRRLLAEELRLGESDIEARTPFVDLGLDSISGVTWIRKINAEFGLAIEATKIYSHPNLQQLSRYIGELSQAHANIPGPSHIEPKAEVAVERVPTPVAIKKAGATFVGWEKLASWRDDSSVAASTSHSTPAQAPAIAVIGMAGRFPMAKDLERFWDNIANGKNCISEVPPSRWNMDALFVDGRAVLGQSSSKWMGVLEGHDQFDPLFFGLSPIEAEAMDPQQRLFLQCCWHGMENAGYTAERLSGSKCGVFVGCAHGDYNLLSREQQISALGFTGGAPSILAARVAYFLNLQGPCISIDTACSSSLVAIATACDSLITGASDVAFAGGVYVMANADMFLKTSHAGMLSPDGRCYTFDQRANGFVPGEGVGIVLLKRLADAERDGDRILAVVRGWGVNQDGKTNGITAPNADSQQRLIKDVYSRFSIDPRQIQLIEAHGTGTKLGDPIEIEALKSAFSAATQDRNYCAVGSVKTNIGHCLTAAGISGFIKLLLAIRHRQLPPSINFETPNEHLGLDNSPFYVNTALREWETPVEVPRQAAISSFGFSGTNAHIVLTEYTPPVSQAATSVVAPHAGFVIPISARTPEQLLQKARDLRDFMQAQRGLSLAELSSSLQLNRDPMEERLCFVAHDVPQAIDDLSIYIDAAAAGKPLPVQLFAANIKQGRESIRLFSEDDDVRTLVIDKCIAEGGMSRLCELWVKGLVLDWRKLYGSHRPSSISLPLYPFAAESYWVTPTVPSIDAVSVRGSELPRKFHPLLHEKVADIADQGYRQDASADDSLMDGDKKIRLMHLPTYAFARMRCWFSSKESLRSSDSARVVPLPTPHRRLGKGLDSIAELFTELEQGKVTTGEVVKRVKSLA